MMERGGKKRPEAHSRMVIERSRYGSWEIMSFLKPVFPVGFQQFDLYVAKRFSSSHHGGTNHPPRPMRENTERGKSSHGEPSARPVAFLEAAKSILGLGALALSCASSFISTFKGKCVSCPGTVLGNSTSSACPRSLHAEWETATQIAVVQDDCCPGGHRGGLEPHIRAGGTWR